MTQKATSICAVVVNCTGQILPYTVQSTCSQCEEAAFARWGATWEKMKELGARVVQAELRIVQGGDLENSTPTDSLHQIS